MQSHNVNQIVISYLNTNQLPTFFSNLSTQNKTTYIFNPHANQIYSMPHINYYLRTLSPTLSIIIKKLTISNLNGNTNDRTTLQTLNNIPPTLTHLSFKNFSLSHNFVPALNIAISKLIHLRTLHIIQSPSINNLIVPPTVKTVIIENQEYITSPMHIIFTNPTKIKHLIIESTYRKLHNDIFPSTTKLNISGCHTYDQCTKLKTLVISHTHSHPPSSLKHLKHLTLTYHDIQTIPQIHKLTHLKILYCNSLHSFSSSPYTHIRTLHIDSCSFLQNIPLQLFPQLINFTLINCTKVSQIQHTKQTQLKYIHIHIHINDIITHKKSPHPLHSSIISLITNSPNLRRIHLINPQNMQFNFDANPLLTHINLQNFLNLHFSSDHITNLPLPNAQSITITHPSPQFNPNIHLHLNPLSILHLSLRNCSLPNINFVSSLPNLLTLDITASRTKPYPLQHKLTSIEPISRKSLANGRNSGQW